LSIGRNSSQHAAARFSGGRAVAAQNKLEQRYTDAMKFISSFALAALTLSLFTASAQAQNAQLPNEISADLGSCSAELFVTGPDTKPVYGAKVTTHIQYGMMGIKKLDLSAYTDAQGHLKLTHLPLTLKKPLYIHVAKDDKEQIVSFKPESECEAKFKVVLY
jgi:hypothetical protein